METIRTQYLGQLRTEAMHVKSGNKLLTDAPTDNNGKGETFSPSDLLVASLGSCMLTIMGIVAERHAIDIRGTTVKLTKIMAANPRRVSEVQIQFDMPARTYTDKDKKLLEEAAKTCPVAESLHPDLVQNVVFNYPQAS